VAAADFDGDLKLDLVVTTRNGLALLPGNGDGTFRGAVALGIDTHMLLAAAADRDRDGKMDLVTANAESGTVSVLLNQR